MKRERGFTLVELMMGILLTTFLILVLIPIGARVGEHFTVAAGYASDLESGVAVSDRIAREVRCARSVRGGDGESLVLEDPSGGTRTIVTVAERFRPGRAVRLERRDMQGKLLATEQLGTVGALAFRAFARGGKVTLVTFDVDLVPHGSGRRAALSSCALVAAGEVP
jgi:hypothetical protein